MKNIVFLSLIYLTISCKPSYNIAALKESGCGDYRFGMIECKRLLKDEDKDLLEKKVFLFRTIYLIRYIRGFGIRTGIK